MVESSASNVAESESEDTSVEKQVIIECTAFECSLSENGRIRLVAKNAVRRIEANFLDPNGTRILYTDDVAKILGKSPKTIQRLIRRDRRGRRKGIPFIINRGRPFFIFES